MEKSYSTAVDGGSEADPRRGWTLVELLVAMSIMMVIGGMMFALFMGVWRIWDGISRSASWSAQAPAWLERYDADLHGALPAAGVVLSGDESGLSLVRPAQREVRSLLRIHYSWDGEATLHRTEQVWDWPTPVNRGRPRRETESRLMLRTFELAYGVQAPEGGLGWQPRWLNQTNAPDAVRLRWSPPDAGGEIERLILLPAGPVIATQQEAGL